MYRKVPLLQDLRTICVLTGRRVDVSNDHIRRCMADMHGMGLILWPHPVSGIDTGGELPSQKGIVRRGWKWWTFPSQLGQMGLDAVILAQCSINSERCTVWLETCTADVHAALASLR